MVATLALAVHVLLVRPFAPAQAWKGPVRAALLTLAAASAAVVAWAGALDLRILTGTGAARALTAGSYTLAVLFGLTLAVLIGSVATAMLKGAKAEEEEARIRAAGSPHRRRVGPRNDATAASASHRAIAVVTAGDGAAQPDRPAAAVAAAPPAAAAAASDLHDAMRDIAFAVRPTSVRRQQTGGRGGGSSRRLQRLSRRGTSPAPTAGGTALAAESRAGL